MNNNLTEIIFILDRSGSMGIRTNEAIEGFNTFLQEQKPQVADIIKPKNNKVRPLKGVLPNNDQEVVKFTLVLFDHEYLIPYYRVDINNVLELTPKSYIPRGGTALFDAVGRTLNQIKEEHIKMEDEKPARTIIGIFTDGEENSSREYNMSMINELITQCQNELDWQIMFLAANQDAMATANNIGINTQMVANLDNSAGGYVRGFATMSYVSNTVRSQNAGNYVIGDSVQAVYDNTNTLLNNQDE